MEKEEFEEARENLPLVELDYREMETKGVIMGEAGFF
jgi:hypothetical protein